MAATKTEEQWAAWLLDLLLQHRDDVVRRWTATQEQRGASLGTGGPARDLRLDARNVLDALADGLRAGRISEPAGPEYEPLRRQLDDLSLRGARGGATPTETATSVLSLKEALVGVALELPDDAQDLLTATVVIGRLVDGLALFTFEMYVRGREEVIHRQGKQLLELSTPVVKMWDGVVGVPLVGTLDSARAQVVMESLLQAIVDEQAWVAILDITGVPTVDTLVAQHLLKTVTATRLMGADCIISGIRPQTALTIVQLGIDLTDITTRATLQAALATAIERVAARSSA